MITLFQKIKIIAVKKKTIGWCNIRDIFHMDYKALFREFFKENVRQIVAIIIWRDNNEYILA